MKVIGVQDCLRVRILVHQGIGIRQMSFGYWLG